MCTDHNEVQSFDAFISMSYCFVCALITMKLFMSKVLMNFFDMFVHIHFSICIL